MKTFKKILARATLFLLVWGFIFVSMIGGHTGIPELKAMLYASFFVAVSAFVFMGLVFFAIDNWNGGK